MAMQSNGPAIEAVGLTRDYRSRTGWFRSKETIVHAVREVDLSIGRGELFGLLGPNGAGKTTTIKLLNTLLVPTSGTARVMGYDVIEQTRAVRRRIGYVAGGDRGLYDRLSAWDNLRYFAELYEVEQRDQRRRISELLDLVGLTGREHDRVEGYSRGMRQRVHIARGLLHSPDVLFLDEPSLGVDPVAARELRTTIADLVGRGTTVVLTTHYMAEAEQLCDRIAVIADGVIRAMGTPLELTRLTAGRRVLVVETYGAGPDHCARIRALPDVCAFSMETREQVEVLTIHTETWADVQPLVLDILDGVRIGRVDSRSPTLEDAYVAIVTDAARRPAVAEAG